MNINPDEVMTFLEFAEERHRIWEQRQRGVPPPWTSDPILAHHKFTNVFRILDPGSQFVLTDLADPELDDREMLARLTLYRLTNLPATWTWVRAFGRWPRYPLLDDMGEDLIADWNEYRDQGFKVFSGAYMITPDGNIPGTDKIRTVVERVRRMFTEGSDVDVMPAWRDATDQRGRYEALRAAPVIGDFMAMQVLTDFGYTPQGGVYGDLEDEFVVLGPGARKGAKEIGTAKVDEIHRYLVGAIRSSPGCPMLWCNEDLFSPRVPSWMDVQNLLCEYSKYARFARKASVTAASSVPYRPAHPGPQPPVVLPDHWL